MGNSSINTFSSIIIAPPAPPLATALLRFGIVEERLTKQWYQSLRWNCGMDLFGIFTCDVDDESKFGSVSTFWGRDCEIIDFFPIIWGVLLNLH